MTAWPTRRRRIVARWAGLALALGLGAGAQANPGPTAPAEGADAVQTGRSLYGRNCSHCHGFNMVNPGTVSFDLRRFPKEDPDRFFHSVREGKGAMPAWKQSLTDEQIRQIWAYVQTGGKP